MLTMRKIGQSKVNGIIESADYSSKAHAIGGTGVTSQTGPAKDWAIGTGAVDSSGEFSSKKYAIGDMTTGSAKQWALGGGSGFNTNTVVAGGLYSAKYYAEQAQNSASSASGSLSVFKRYTLAVVHQTQLLDMLLVTCFSNQRLHETSLLHREHVGLYQQTQV